MTEKVFIRMERNEGSRIAGVRRKCHGQYIDGSKRCNPSIAMSKVT